jgi:SWI/SNF-related matrix-associated actin-dependent regulator 1 of chromatin subfamily A
MAAPKVGDLIRIVMGPALARHLGCQRRVCGRVTGVNEKTVTIRGRGELMAGGEGGACWMCGQPLTNPASVQVGVGPDCAKQIGIAWLGNVRDRRLTDDELARVKADLAVERTLPLLGINWGPLDGPAPVLSMERPSRRTPGDNIVFPQIEARPEQLEELQLSPPKGLAYRPYQEEDIRFWLTQPNIINANDMGMGKTPEALGTIREVLYAVRDDPAFCGVKVIPSVVLCPKSLKKNWLSEARTWAPELRVQIIEGRDDKLLKNQHLYVCHYEATWSPRGADGLSKVGRALASMQKAVFAADESHRLKTLEARRTQAAALIAEKARYRAMLSGTPMEARPRELLSQLLILGELDGRFVSPTAFRTRFCNLTLKRMTVTVNTPRGPRRVQRRVWDDSGRSNLQELRARLLPIMIRRKKEDHLAELPSKTYARVTVELSNEAEYRRLEEQMAEAEGGAQAGMLATLRRTLAEGKVEAALDWIDLFMAQTEDDAGKLVVFAYHRGVQQAIVEANPGCARILADADMKKLGLDIEAEKERFATDPSCRLIVCSLAAAGFGHTLTAASNLLNVELHPTPGVMDQAADRIYRIGQHYPCTIWTLVAEGTVDDRLTELLVEKRQATGITIDGAEQVLDEQTVNRAAILDVLKRVKERKEGRAA